VKPRLSKTSVAGLLIALGIIYGDLGTSPLYVFNAVLTDRLITTDLVIGAVSCIIWTLTLQTTVKYVLLTMKADNKGEGGIFSLYTLVRRRKRWLVLPAMIGGAALLADGMISPPITITSAIEGLRQIPALEFLGREEHISTIMYIVLGILVILFFVQQVGTSSIGRAFGPIMSVWFFMLAVVGLLHIHEDLGVFKAFNPYYGIKLLITYPKGFWILGAVFLCTTGGEALYNDLGHCGRSNIRISWIYVKICLILNYLGQAAFLISHMNGQEFPANSNPFFIIVPEKFLLVSVIIAAVAAIIASQAIISGAFTLIGEAIRLNLWPRLKINYPSDEKGQLYIPGVNLLLFIGCVGMVLFFKQSKYMEAAYGLAITLAMIATTILFANYLVSKRTKPLWVYIFLVVYFIIETSFLIANLDKFRHGGYATLIIAGMLFTVMYVWFRARKIKNRYVEFIRMEDFIPKIQELSNDRSIAKCATHLIYLTSADNPREIEHKIIYSILNRKPKRADIYWFIHVDTMDAPHTSEYKVEHIIPNDIIRIDFKLGFRVQPRVHLLFKKVVEDLVANKEVNIISRYESLASSNIAGDFQFVVMEKYLSQDNELPFIEKLIMKIHFWIKQISLSEERGFGLDQANVSVEKFPLIVAPVTNVELKRIE
jgi:KUP system potassium uptake protein